MALRLPIGLFHAPFAKLTPWTKTPKKSWLSKGASTYLRPIAPMADTIPCGPCEECDESAYDGLHHSIVEAIDAAEAMAKAHHRKKHRGKA
jgi:hypothetical protein